MADRQVPPDFNPKYRIVGAIVLVALLVVFVPMILDERATPPELDSGRAAPHVEPPPTKVVITPVPVEAPKPAPAVAAPKAEAMPAPKPEPEKSKSEPEKPKAAKIENGWMVQVGTFTQVENATRLRDKLKKFGHVVHTDTVSVGGKKALRLRVGPFAERAMADKAQGQIRQEIGITGVVQSQS